MKIQKRIKKYVSFLLIGMIVLTIAGCGNKKPKDDTVKNPDEITINTPNAKEIALTPENYTEYLNMSIYCTEGGESISLNKPIALAPDYDQGFAYSKITGFLSTQTASSQISFKDVKVKAEITGTYKACSASNINETKEDSFKLTIETPIDASGEVLKSTNFELPEGFVTLTSFIAYEYKIVEISGTVIK